MSPALGFAPAAISARIVSVLPRAAAKCSGVLPSLSLIVTSAPESISVCAVSVLPMDAALCSRVRPSPPFLFTSANSSRVKAGTFASPPKYGLQRLHPRTGRRVKFRAISLVEKPLQFGGFAQFLTYTQVPLCSVTPAAVSLSQYFDSLEAVGEFPADWAGGADVVWDGGSGSPSADAAPTLGSSRSISAWMRDCFRRSSIISVRIISVWRAMRSVSRRFSIAWIWRSRRSSSRWRLASFRRCSAFASRSFSGRLSSASLDVAITFSAAPSDRAPYSRSIPSAARMIWRSMPAMRSGSAVLIEGASNLSPAMRTRMSWGSLGRLAARSATVIASASAALTAMSFSTFVLSFLSSANEIATIMERISSPSAMRKAGRDACMRVGERL